MFLKKLILLLFPLLVISAQSWSNPISIDQSEMVYALEDYELSIFEDQSNSLSLDSILNIPDAFAESSQQSLNFGFTNSAYWIKFDVDNKCRELTRIGLPLQNAPPPLCA